MLRPWICLDMEIRSRRPKRLLRWFSKISWSLVLNAEHLSRIWKCMGGSRRKHRNMICRRHGGFLTTITNFSKSQYPVLFIVAIAIGGVFGTWLDIDGRFKRLVNSRSKDGRSRLADGLSTAILLYCIGPLSMLGPVISALKGDNTFLFTNATLDLVSSIVFASTYGIGMALAAPVLFCWQGMFYLIAKISATAVSDELMAELLIVGGLMITGSGLSLLQLKDCKTLNLLPALLVPVVWFLLMALLPL